MQQHGDRWWLPARTQLCTPHPVTTLPHPCTPASCAPSLPRPHSPTAPHPYNRTLMPPPHPPQQPRTPVAFAHAPPPPCTRTPPFRSQTRKLEATNKTLIDAVHELLADFQINIALDLSDKTSSERHARPPVPAVPVPVVHEGREACPRRQGPVSPIVLNAPYPYFSRTIPVP